MDNNYDLYYEFLPGEEDNEAYENVMDSIKDIVAEYSFDVDYYRQYSGLLD